MQEVLIVQEVQDVEDDIFSVGVGIVISLEIAGSAGRASTLFANRTELLVLFNLDKHSPEEVNLGLQRFWWLSTPCFCPATSVLDSRQGGGDR